MQFWGTQLLSLLLGVAGSLIATVLWERKKKGPAVDSEWRARLLSADQSVVSQAFRECMVNAARWYLLANILWVVSGAAWALELGVESGFVFSRIVLGVTSVLAMLMFAASLYWVRLYARCAVRPRSAG